MILRDDSMSESTESGQTIGGDARVGPGTSYTDAARELSDIVGRLEAGELGVDAVVGALTRAGSLIEYCRAQVVGAQAQVKDITERASKAAGAAN